MAFIEPMHRNKPNITYLLLQGKESLTNTQKLDQDIKFTQDARDHHEVMTSFVQPVDLAAGCCGLHTYHHAVTTGKTP